MWLCGGGGGAESIVVRLWGGVWKVEGVYEWTAMRLLGRLECAE